MSDQSQTTANAPSEPRLCKMGCGFFGNGATGDCCSKCWIELQKKMQPAPAAESRPHPETPVVAEKCVLCEVTEVAEAGQVEPCNAPSTQRKRKKKASYKSMMAGMMQSKSPQRDIEKEKETLRKVTGGGAFTKIDKI